MLLCQEKVNISSQNNPCNLSFFQFSESDADSQQNPPIATENPKKLNEPVVGHVVQRSASNMTLNFSVAFFSVTCLLWNKIETEWDSGNCKVSYHLKV